MSLITLPAFWTRRREETPMPEITAEKKADVVMRFMTRGGAVVEIRQQVRYSIRCLGCDYGEVDFSIAANARNEANAHAGACWSMPKSASQAAGV